MRGLRATLITLFAVLGCEGSTVRPSSPSSNPDASAAADADPVTHDDAAVVDAGTADSGTPDSGSHSAVPITAPAMEWTWVDFPQSSCMNDTPTGIGVNLNPASTKVMIFMNGGNACFNQTTCFITANTDGYGEGKFNNERGGLNGSAFSRTSTSNPLRDWNYVYLPYCTGDVFSGTNDAVTVAGTQWKFVGYRNVGHFLERLVPTFPNATDVLLTGVSAGGFGAMVNFDRVQRAFGDNVRVTLVNDSGAPLPSTYLSPCLQDHFRNTWGMDAGPLAECADCLATPDRSFVEPYSEYLKTMYPDRSLALISSEADATIRTFYGYGLDNCMGLNALFAPTFRAEPFRMGLVSLRDDVFGDMGNFKLWMPQGERHVWLSSPPWTVELDGVRLSDWMMQAINGDASWSHVPAP